jgi:hypothetical protein
MDHNLLVAARTEYTEKLQDVLSEGIYKGIKNIWNECKSEGKTNLLMKFQNKLCQIPKWNQDVIDKCCDETLISDGYLDKIIEAVFLSNVKILSVVKLNDNKKTINVSVPNTKHFIHRCYIESARRFYTDPYLIDDRESNVNTLNEIQRNIKRSLTVIRDSIEKTIRSMIPMEDILTKYLAQEQEETVQDYHRDPSPEPEPEYNREPSPEPIEQEEEDPEDLFTQRPEPNLEPTTQEIPQPVPQLFEQPVTQPQLSEETKRINVAKENNFFSDSD